MIWQRFFGWFGMVRRTLLDCVFIFVVGVGIGWFFDTEPPLTVHKVSVASVDEKRVNICFDATRNRACAFSVERGLKCNGEDYAMPARTMESIGLDVQPGDRNPRACTSIALPYGIPKGARCVLRSLPNYHCNPLQRVFPLQIETAEVKFVYP